MIFSLIDNEQAAIARAKKAKAIVNTIDWVSYYTYDQIYQWIDEQVAAYPQYLNVTTIGMSAEGRPIKLVTLSKRAVRL